MWKGRGKGEKGEGRGGGNNVFHEIFFSSPLVSVKRDVFSFNTRLNVAIIFHLNVFLRLAYKSQSNFFFNVFEFRV